jgi:alpha-glucosidase
LRRWRAIADSYDPPRLLVGETPVDDAATLAAFYGPDLDELQLAFNFPFINAPLEVEPMRGVVEGIEAMLPPGAWPAWTGSNHDMFRLATRWANDDPQRARVALMMLLGLRGTAVLYQGDEIGLRDVAVVPPDLRDPLGVKYWPAYAGRDAGRTPAEVRPWLPIGSTERNVADQVGDAESLLVLVRDVVAFRRRIPDLSLGAYERMPAADGVWAWRRGTRHAVVVRLADGAAVVDGIDGGVVIATDRARDGEVVHRSLALHGWDGCVVELSATGTAGADG